jgi:ABC-type multidrug transport system ATPase subunit
MGMKLQEIGSEEELRKLFEENHLEFQDSNGDDTGKNGDWNFVFNDKRNLVIGPNGGGKTRFLKMIYQYYTKVLHYSKNKIVFIDFPDFEKNEKTIAEENPLQFDDDMYDLMGSGFDCSLDDFLYKIANEKDEFIDRLLNKTKRKLNGQYKEYHDNILRALNRYFTELLSIELNVVGKGKSSEIQWKHHSKLISNIEGLENGLIDYIQLMSPGERNLFYIVLFICCFHNFSVERELVILLDEPELHLHTDKIRKFIRLIQEEFKTKKVTFWIASHSIPLLSDFRFSEIILMNQGKIQPRGSNYYKTIYEIMQGTDVGLKLLLADIENWEYYNFIQECFERPKTVLDQNKQDPQWLALTDMINQVLEQNTVITVLDFGSGQGRFGYYCSDQDYITYYTYDEYMAQPENSKGHFKSEEALRDSGIKFTCVLLVNTLHEIDISKWITVFRCIENVLADNGFLFFCEAALLPEGEFPYDNCGYLILGKDEIQALFGKTAYALERNKKIYAAGISKDRLKKFVESGEANQGKRMYKAMYSLERRSFQMVEELLQYRKDQLKNQEQLEMLEQAEALEQHKKSTVIARKYGFYSQQYINAQMAVKALNLFDEYSENAEQNEYEEPQDEVEILEGFEKKIRVAVKKLYPDQQVYFAWLCAVRALPMLLSGGSIGFWEENKFQKYLYDVLYALDVALYYYYKTTYNTSVFGIDTAGDAAYAAYTAAFIANDANDAANAAYAAVYTANDASEANVAYAAAYAAYAAAKAAYAAHDAANANHTAYDDAKAAYAAAKAAYAAYDAKTANDTNGAYASYDANATYATKAAQAASDAAQAINDAKAANDAYDAAKAAYSDAVKSAKAAYDAKAAYAAKASYATKAAYATQAAQAAYADAAKAAANAAVGKFSGIKNSTQFKTIITNDLKCIQTDDKSSIDNSIKIYGKVWATFHETLWRLGCGYWSQLYQRIFSNKFEIDVIELYRRINVPEEIRAQGAAAVGKYLSESSE